MKTKQDHTAAEAEAAAGAGAAGAGRNTTAPAATQHYTTLVVGAGPAGAMCAAEAAARGPVLLVDAFTLPRDKSCGGMLNEYAQAFLHERFGEIDARLLSEPQRINFRFFDWDRDLRKATTLSFVNVERCLFDDWLLHTLPDAVEVRGATRLVALTQTDEGVEALLRPADDASAAPVRVTCDYLVGCDGPRSTVRRCLPVPQVALYRTLQDYLPLEKPLEPFFDCVYARGLGDAYGYGYVVPKGKLAIVGSVFYPGSRHVREVHERALDMYRSFYPYAAHSEKREAWTAAQVKNAADIVTGQRRVLLAGEAGGLFSPSSGEGISFALNSGARAGKAIAHAREGATVLGKRAHASWDESEALRLYRASMQPIVANIMRRLRYFPVLDSDLGKDLARFAPDALVDFVAHRI